MRYIGTTLWPTGFKGQHARPADPPGPQEGETMGTYAAHVRYYACRGYPTFEEAVREELALGAFIHGLTPE